MDVRPSQPDAQKKKWSPKPFRRLVQSLLPHASGASRGSKLHGPRHWERVARTGAYLCDATDGAEAHVVHLFAAFHDAVRFSDGADPKHGERGAALAVRLRGKLFEATDEQMSILIEVCTYHTDGDVSSDPTIGCCWDADRLDLGRCGIRPDAAYLSTAAGKAELEKKEGT